MRCQRDCYSTDNSAKSGRSVGLMSPSTDIISVVSTNETSSVFCRMESTTSCGGALAQVRRVPSEDCYVRTHGFSARLSIANEHHSTSLSGRAEGLPNATRDERQKAGNGICRPPILRPQTTIFIAYGINIEKRVVLARVHTLPMERMDSETLISDVMNSEISPQ